MFYVTMYAKCDKLRKAKELLDMHKSNNVCTWTALIMGYAWEGCGKNDLDYFEVMRCKGILPIVMTFICLLKACAMIGTIDKERKVHDKVARRGLLHNNGQCSSGHAR